MVKLFVGGFPLDMTELDLVKIISLHGEVSTIKIVRDKKTRICKGYAFLEMKDREGAENAAIALDGSEIGDRVLSVKINEDTPAKPAPPKRSFNSSYNNGRSNNSYGNSSTSNDARRSPGAAPDASRSKRPRRPIG